MRHNGQHLIRAVERQDHTAHCLECDAETAEAKPYCPRHVELMPYVADLLASRSPRGRGRLADRQALPV